MHDPRCPHEYAELDLNFFAAFFIALINFLLASLIKITSATLTVAGKCGQPKPLERLAVFFEYLAFLVRIQIEVLLNLLLVGLVT